ncbi:MAG: HAD family phosphatase [Clostridia bacterium]|nr:HAD family phosphatase [Clostridia bacterium]
MKKYYIFDLDGTLIDSMPVGVGITLSFLDEQGIPYPPDVVKTLTPLGYKGIAKLFAEELGVKCTAEEIYQRFQTQNERAYAETIPLKPHAKELLEFLKSQGHSISVLTASPNHFIELSLKRLGVYHLLDNAWSIDDFGMSKADEEIYRAAAARLGANIGDCIMVDDNVNVLKTAKRAGMGAIGVYDKFTSYTEPEMREIADGYVHDFVELINQSNIIRTKIFGGKFRRLLR